MQMTEKQWLLRILFLETVAGVPGVPHFHHSFNTNVSLSQLRECISSIDTHCLTNVSFFAGMVGGMLRHMRSLRTLRRDYGRIHTLLEEAENERMHLLTFMQMAKPGIFFRAAVLGAQVRVRMPVQ